MDRRTLIGSGLIVGLLVVMAALGNGGSKPAPVPNAPVVPQINASNVRPAVAAPQAPIIPCAQPPSNGQILNSLTGFEAKQNTFEFDNGTGRNAIVKLRDVRTGRVAVSFFVSAHSTASYDKLDDGTYRVQYAMGSDLAQDCRSFARLTSVQQSVEPETLIARKTDDGTYFKVLTYTIFAEQSGGNVRAVTIDPKDFDAN